MSALPVRSCVGCGRKASQAELVRFVAADGRLVLGDGLPGRGAYTCRRLQCYERAVARRGFSRALRRTLAVEPDLKALYT